MTLLFVEGFDHYAEGEEIMKWDNAQDYPGNNIGSAYGRFSGQGYSLLYTYQGLSRMHKTLPTSYSTLVFGAALNLRGTPTTTTEGSASIFSFLDDVTYQLYVAPNPDRTLSVYNNAVLLGTSTATLPPNEWIYFEIKVTFDSTSGTVDIKLDETNVLSLSGVNTDLSGNGTANKIMINAPNYNVEMWWDDVYVCDTSGTKNNDFLGDSRVETLYPTGVGNYSQFTPVSGSNYEMVDDPTDIDEVGTYNSASAAGAKDTYAFGDTTITDKVIHGVAVNTCLRKDDAGSKTFKPLFRINSTDYAVGSSVEVPDNYMVRQVIVEDNPDDSAAWEGADVNAMELGIEIIS